MPLRLLRILHLDDSDTQVYLPAARAGEPAVPGTFMFTFAGIDPERLGGSDAQAFHSGFLGLDSLGWGTLVTVAEVDEFERRAAEDRLTAIFLDRFGAPDEAAARAQTREEFAFVDQLCQQPVNTIISLERTVDDEEVEEQFRTHSQQADWQASHPVIRIVPEDEAK